MVWTNLPASSRIGTLTLQVVAPDVSRVIVGCRTLPQVQKAYQLDGVGTLRHQVPFHIGESVTVTS